MSDLLPPPPVAPPIPGPPPPASASERTVTPQHDVRAIDFGGHKGTPLTPVGWPWPLMFVLVAIAVASTYGGSWIAYRSGILRDMTPDVRAIALTTIIFLQYLPAIVVAFLWARGRGVGFSEAFAVRRFKLGAGIGMAIGLAFVGRALGVQYALFMNRLGVVAPETPDITRFFPASPIGVMATIMTAVVIAPLAEEAIFRGVVFPGLRERWGQIAGIVVSSALFALIHFQWYQFVPILLLGVLLAWVTSATRSIWPAVVCHAVFNGSGVALLYLLRALKVGG
ncbi:MAG: CPBP family intramembrane metalloprotease [Actinobacteria bacterium]|nr:MAG: CPBP family intramembrane metalloprotease [Actinomycetota bacterium]